MIGKMPGHHRTTKTHGNAWVGDVSLADASQNSTHVAFSSPLHELTQSPTWLDHSDRRSVALRQTKLCRR